MTSPGETDTAATRPPRPRLIETAAGLLVLAGLGAILTAISLRAARGTFTAYVLQTARKNNTTDKLPNPLDAAINSYVNAQLIEGVVLAVILALIARMVWAGRSWSRWAALALYVLATFSTPIGFGAITAIAGDEPPALKFPGFLTSVAFLAAVVLLNLPKSTQWLNFGRPAPAGGGLFGPRPAGQRPAARTGGGLFSRPPARPRGADRTVDVEPAKVVTQPAEQPAARDAGPAKTGASAARTKSAGKAKGGRTTPKSRRS